MRKFIFKILLFCCITLSAIVLFYAYLFLKKKDEIYIPKKNIIIGDSNTRWSINDKKLASYSNYSVGGETYLFAYTKLKILDNNNKIDTLMLSFSPHNIINNMWWNDDEDQPILGRMPAFYSDFSLEDHLAMLKLIPKNYIKSLFKIGGEQIKDMIKPKDKMLRFGFYMPTKQNEFEFRREFYKYKKPEISNIETEYLQKIIDECQEKKIYLILIETPKNYLRNDYKNYEHKEFYDYYTAHLKNIDFLDFSKLELPQKSYYDINHVCTKGAEFFSDFLKDKGIKNLLKSEYNLKKSVR